MVLQAKIYVNLQGLIPTRKIPVLFYSKRNHNPTVVGHKESLYIKEMSCDKN